MDLPEPDRFSMSFRVSCRFGAMVLAIVSVASLSEAAQGEITSDVTSEDGSGDCRYLGWAGDGGGVSGAAVVAALYRHGHAPGAKILAMVEMTASDHPGVRHQGCVRASFLWSG